MAQMPCSWPVEYAPVEYAPVAYNPTRHTLRVWVRQNVYPKNVQLTCEHCGKAWQCEFGGRAQITPIFCKGRIDAIASCSSAG